MQEPGLHAEAPGSGPDGKDVVWAWVGVLSCLVSIKVLAQPKLDDFEPLVFLLPPPSRRTTGLCYHTGAGDQSQGSMLAEQTLPTGLERWLTG